MLRAPRDAHEPQTRRPAAESDSHAPISRMSASRAAVWSDDSLIRAMRAGSTPIVQRRPLERAFAGATWAEGAPAAEPLQPKTARPIAEPVAPDVGEAPVRGEASAAQRKQGGDDEELQMKSAATTSQLQSPPKADPGHTGLPKALKTNVESLSGLSLDHVEVHHNSPEPAQMNALAFAQGKDIHLGPGQERHLPHEAWHVVQQMQRRVQPTTQAKGHSPINDDERLEREADEMGAKAASGGGSHAVQGKTIAGPGATAPIQAVMSLAEFQGLTPGIPLIKPRDTILGIDALLSAYIQTRTIANAANLMAGITHYVGGNHDAGRKAVANDLHTRVDAEHQLLQQIGDPNAFLVDSLIQQADIGRLAALVQLATDATAANATVLPHLIAMIGDTNIVNLNLSGLVGAMGAAHVPLLPAMIVNSGGIAQRINLFNIVNRHPNHGDLAFDLTAAAAGDPVKFQRLANEVPLFVQAAPPGAGGLAGVAAAVAAYNAAIPPAALNFMNALLADANIAHAQATALAAVVVPAVAPAGLAAGLLANIGVRIAAVNARIAALGLAGPGLGGAPDVLAANQVRAIIFNTLPVQVGLRVAQLNAAAIALPGGFNQAAFDAAVAGVAAAATAVLNSSAPNNPPTIAGVSEDHFLTRHTAQHFDFGEIKEDNTQWPTAWAGANAAANVGAQLVAVLNGLAATGIWLEPNVAHANLATPSGATAQIASRPGAAANTINVGQFFPEATAAAQVYDHPDTTMIAIRKVR